MTHSYGLKKGTRSKFAKPFRGHGNISIRKTLQTFKRGDFVDILVDGAQHKGVPFQYYHGRTARVFNVNPRGIGVSLQRRVRGRYVEKRFHVRADHLRPSKCREEFVKRVQENDKKKTEANKLKQHISTKRQPVLPRTAEIVKPTATVFQHPKAFVEII
ncbi:unnamed protein product [Paramecium primaurelia]|uniref:60S ribosomal protein L21 n=2 Tax=Paramecium TaxID=5884 RepID=A0A8S1TXH7_9CILI|nr:unnamed protein product [Paramecium primaurelia]CAD8155446.1 unnamed protein product [Paramecium pentaurelia]